MSAKGSSNGWDRVNFNVRLTKRRREQLKSRAADLPMTATPVDAVDRAIALAMQARAGHVAGERLYDLEDLIEQHAMKSLFEFDKMGEGLGAVKKSMDDLRVLISAVAGTEVELWGHPAVSVVLALGVGIIAGRRRRPTLVVIVVSALLATDAAIAGRLVSQLLTPLAVLVVVSFTLGNTTTSWGRPVRR